MTNDEFQIFLEKCNLSKKQFAELTELPYQTIMNWKRNNNSPNWVKSWLENYIAKRKFEKMKELIKE